MGIRFLGGDGGGLVREEKNFLSRRTCNISRVLFFILFFLWRLKSKSENNEISRLFNSKERIIFY